MRTLIIAVIAAALVAACSSSPSGPEQSGAPVEDRGPGSGASTSQPVGTPDVKTLRPDTAGDAGLAILKDPKSILSKRSVFFDYDSYVIKDEFKSLIEAHARFLVANQRMRMLIQGNADERGSREYNIALGQKRADAVKHALSVLGVKEEQIESVSLGEEKPRNPGHDEAAWAENRRSDMLYSGEF